MPLRGPHGGSDGSVFNLDITRVAALGEDIFLALRFDDEKVLVGLEKLDDDRFLRL